MDNYHVIAELGRGSHGQALLVQHTLTKDVVVAKSLLFRRDQNRHIEEATVLQSLDHPNIIRYVDCVHDSDSWMLMEYAEGGDLAGYIAQHKETREGGVAEAEVMRVFIQLCLAVQYIHSRNILHRDIKPQNVFLTKDGVVKLGDFGIARALDHTFDAAQTQIGTPLYLSPEICEGADYNAKSDMWTVGCVLHELLALAPPFQAKSMPLIVTRILQGTPDPIPSHYSPDLQSLVLRLLSKSPDDRPRASDILSSAFVQSHLMQLASVAPRQPPRSLHRPPPPSQPQSTLDAAPSPAPTSLLDFVPEYSPPPVPQQQCGRDASSVVDIARQQYLDNQRAARLYKERMDQLNNPPPPFLRAPAPLPSPNVESHPSLEPSSKGHLPYEQLLAAERQRVYAETRALQQRMRAMQASGQPS